MYRILCRNSYVRIFVLNNSHVHVLDTYTYESDLILLQMVMIMQTESSLDCPICTNRYTVDGPLQPKLLKCGHTFCTNCIQKISKTEKNSIKCPYCFGVTPIEALGIYALPVNRTLVDILYNIKLKRSLKVDTTPVDLCCICNDPAEKICFDCDSNGCKLCEVCCIAEHSRPFPPVQMHKTLNIDEVSSSFCVKHKQLLTHYSEEAAIFACEECLAEFVDVDFLPMEAAIQTLRQRLPKMMEGLESYLRRLQDAQRIMETIRGDLGRTKPMAMQEILKKFSNYQFIFQKQEETLLANLEAEVSGIYYMYIMHCTYIRTYRTRSLNSRVKIFMEW